MSPIPGGLKFREPARRATDLYVAIGFFGTHLIGVCLAITVWVLPEHPLWWHAILGWVFFFVSMLPMAAAVGIFRHVHAVREAAKKRHNERFAHLGAQHRK